MITGISWCAMGVACAAPASRQGVGVASGHLRPFGVDDIFKLQELGSLVGGPCAYSDDGTALAITILRAINTDPSPLWNMLQSDTLQSNSRGDIWVQVDRGEGLRNITHGATDRSGWFSPQWSPDGIHLAMLSTRGGELRLWTWDRVTGRLRPLSRVEVSFSLQQRNTFHDQPYVWLDSQRILFTALPDEPRRGLSRTYEYMRSETPALAGAGWHRYLSGTKSTASVLDDLRDPGLPPGANLTVADLAGGEKVVARNINTLLWQPSPTGEAVAFTRATRIMPAPTEFLHELLADGGDWGAEVATIDGRRVVTTGARASAVIPTSLRWSPSGETLAYLGYGDQSQLSPLLYLLNINTGRVKVAALAGLNASPGGRNPNPGAYSPPGLEWTATGDLLIRGQEVTAASHADSAPDTRQDWWLVSPGGARSCLTCRLRQAPLLLWPERGRKLFFGLASGRILQFDIGSRQILNSTAQLRAPVTAIISPARSFGNQYFVTSNRTLQDRTYDRTAFVAMDRGVARSYLIDFRSLAITPLIPPAKNAEVVAVATNGDSLLYRTNDRLGLRVWSQNVRAGASKLLFRGNTFLLGIARSRLIHFPYTSLDGEELNAWLLLPLGYRTGRRYPMITLFYPTDNYTAPAIPWQLQFYTAPWSDNVLNMQIASAQGYAVLFPSVPVDRQDRSEVGIKVVNEVLPAVASAVGRGFADPHRLAVWGMSYGGEAVFDLITKTDQFKAAIASAGSSDLVSAYGALDARYRYGQWAGEDVDFDAVMESGELNLGVPPWTGELLYIQDSPIFSVNRVHTPLLMTAGDLDFVPMQQSEEFFRALVRQNKPVRLVRYWGEEHELLNPANIQEYWRQIFWWLNRYLGPVNQAEEMSH